MRNSNLRFIFTDHFFSDFGEPSSFELRAFIIIISGSHLSFRYTFHNICDLKERNLTSNLSKNEENCSTVCFLLASFLSNEDSISLVYHNILIFLTIMLFIPFITAFLFLLFPSTLNFPFTKSRLSENGVNIIKKTNKHLNE